jgi:hypothetical protein
MQCVGFYVIAYFGTAALPPAPPKIFIAKVPNERIEMM